MSAAREPDQANFDLDSLNLRHQNETTRIDCVKQYR